MRAISTSIAVTALVISVATAARAAPLDCTSNRLSAIELTKCFPGLFDSQPPQPVDSVPSQKAAPTGGREGADDAPPKAALPDDYEFPIGKIDAQILCKTGQTKASEDPAREERNCLAAFSGIVTRVGDDLRFKLDNEQTKIVRSNSKACKQVPIGDCVVYRLVGYISSSRHFVLGVSFYETEAVELVSQRTGRLIQLEGYPRLSPTGKQFVTVAASDAWEIKNPIAIYSNTDPLKRTWRFPQPQEYEEYSFDGWDGEDRVKLHTITNPRVETDVNRTTDGWALKRPNGQLSLGVSSPSDTPAATPKP
jgi:hypothetical protein